MCESCMELSTEQIWAIYGASDRADVWAMYGASDRADIWAMYEAYMELNIDGGFDDMEADYPVDC